MGVKKKRVIKAIPETGYIRIPEVLSLLPLCRATFYKGIKSGRFPAPTKISARCSAWRVEVIRQLLSDLAAGEA